MRKTINIKRRILCILMAVIMTMTIVPTITADAATPYNGGQGYANTKLNVYKQINGDLYGTIYKDEGFTILRLLEDNWIYVQYSTSNGPKKGYVKRTSSNLEHIGGTCVAKVIKDSNLYYGNNTSTYQKSGSVYTGEIVTVLNRSGGWSFIEYNTNSGRKRGYIKDTCLSCYNDSGKIISDIVIGNSGTRYYVDGFKDVYTGPSTQYKPIGNVSDEEVRRLLVIRRGSQTWRYVKYKVDGTSQYKSGYILEK